jgi:peroxiredoxin
MSRRPGQWTAVGSIVLAVAFTMALALRLRPSPVIIEPGGAAPDFAAVDVVSDRPVSLDTYRGRVVLLNIWATWCVPCRMEMPSMERLHRRFADTDLRVVAVSVDRGDLSQVRQFVHDMNLTFDVLHDRSGDIQRTYQTIGVPESFLIDRDGLVVKKVVGATEWDTPATVALVRRLLDVR